MMHILNSTIKIDMDFNGSFLKNVGLKRKRGIILKKYACIQIFNEFYF